MFKKTLLLFILVFSLGFVNAGFAVDPIVPPIESIIPDLQGEYNEALNGPDGDILRRIEADRAFDAIDKEDQAIYDRSDKIKEEEAREAFCDESKGCIDKASFTISVNDISPGMKVDKNNDTKQNVNYALGTIIQTLMIALGSLALLIMTVGAGYIVLHHGQDELLSKGKSIFMSGVYALVVALSSYYLVAIFRYILFQ